MQLLKDKSPKPLEMQMEVNIINLKLTIIMARTTKADLYAANVIECAPNGILGVFERWEDNRWHHQDADESCASYTDDEIYDRCNGNIDIIGYMQDKL